MLNSYHTENIQPSSYHISTPVRVSQSFGSHPNRLHESAVSAPTTNRDCHHSSSSSSRQRHAIARILPLSSPYSANQRLANTHRRKVSAKTTSAPTRPQFHAYYYVHTYHLSTISATYYPHTYAAYMLRLWFESKSSSVLCVEAQLHCCVSMSVCARSKHVFEPQHSPLRTIAAHAAIPAAVAVSIDGTHTYIQAYMYDFLAL